MMKRHPKLFITLFVVPVLITILYGLYFIGQYLATFTSQRKDSEASFLAGYSFIPKLNPSEKNEHGLMKTYPVSDSYSKFKVKSLLFCRNASKFRGTFEENCHFIQNYPIGDSGPYLQELGFAGDFVDFTNPKIPVVVTAASSNHFLEVQALMQNFYSVVFPKYENLKFIFYDIGLKENEKEMVKKHCRCEYRSFPFEKYPEHVKILKGYTFKPIIVQTVLNEYGFVMWMDTSVRFRTGELDSLFKITIKDGVKFMEGGLGVGYRTDPVTFNFLREDPCLFADKNEIQPTFFLVYRTRFTIETIMRPWVSCALTLGCMYFPGSQERISCMNQNGLGFCHRFDQSVIGIILWRLYHADIGRVYIPVTFFKVQRDHTARYFQSLEEKIDLVLVQSAPFLRNERMFTVLAMVFVFSLKIVLYGSL